MDNFSVENYVDIVSTTLYKLLQKFVDSVGIQLGTDKCYTRCMHRETVRMGDVIELQPPVTIEKLSHEILTLNPDFDATVFPQGIKLIKNPATLQTIREAAAYIKNCTDRNVRMRDQSLLRVLRHQISTVEIIINTLRELGNSSFTARVKYYGTASGYDSPL